MLAAPEIRALERKNERISAVITTVIMVILLLISFLTTLIRHREPAIGEKNYEVLGSIDFGDYKEGSQNVNTLERSVANPTPTPRQAPQPTQSQNQVSQPATPFNTDNPITTEQESPIITPEAPEVKPNVEPTPPAPPVEDKPPVEEPTQDPVSDQPVSETPVENTPEPTLNDEFILGTDDGQAGSNQGNSSGVGNTGSDVPTIDPNAVYSFGTGTGAVEGRSWLNPNFDKSHNAQEEADISFILTIAPNGRVIHVKEVGVNTQRELVRIGKEKIMKFRFSPLPPSAAQVNQKAGPYIMKFRLR